MDILRVDRTGHGVSAQGNVAKEEIQKVVLDVDIGWSGTIGGDEFLRTMTQKMRS